MSRVITISREFGSGGREIGFRVAKKLGIPFYDKELISMASEDSNISEDVFHANDEVIHGKERINYEYATVDPFSSTYEIPVSDQHIICCLSMKQERKCFKLMTASPILNVIKCCRDLKNPVLFVPISFLKRMKLIPGSIQTLS